MRRSHMSGHVALAGLAAISMVSCSSCTKKTAGEDLTIAPKETSLLLSLNLSRMRNTAMWRKILDLRDANPENKKKYDEFVGKCSFDPMVQIESALLFFPPPYGADSQGEWGAVVHGQFDEAKLVACAKEELTKAGRELTIGEHEGKKVYSDPDNGTMRGAFLDGKRAVVGGTKWSEKMIELAAGKAPVAESAKENAALGELIKRAKTSDAVWGVGLVSDAMRGKLEEMPSLSVAKTMKTIVGSMDFMEGLRIDLVVDLGSEADAKELAEKVTQQLAESKKNSTVMMVGLASTIDTIKVSSAGVSFKLSMNLNQTQVEQLIERLEGLLKGGLSRQLQQLNPAQ